MAQFDEIAYDTQLIMNVTSEQLDTHEARLIIEVQPAELAAAQRVVSASISKDFKFPGFRPGKVPMSMVVQAVGAEAFNREVADELAKKLYPQAVDQSGINPYGPGSLEELKLDPPQLIARVPLMPVVDLKDYKSIRLPYEEPVVSDDEIQAQLESIQSENAIVQAAERPAGAGDFIEGKVVAYDADNEALFDLEEKEFVLDPEMESAMHLPGLLAHIVGMTAGSAKSVPMTVGDTEEDENLRGKEVRVEISVDRVNTRELPAIDDTLAQTVGTYSSLSELRTRISEQLLEFKRTQARRTYADRAVEAYTSLSAFTLPPTYMADRLDEAVTELKERIKREDKIEFSDWMKLNGLNDETMREELQKTVEPQARTNLVLGAIRNMEHVTITEPELNAALDRQIELAKSSGVDLKKVAQESGYQLNLSNRLLTDKVVAHIVDLAQGKIMAEPAAADTPSGSPEIAAAP